MTPITTQLSTVEEASMTPEEFGQRQEFGRRQRAMVSASLSRDEDRHKAHNVYRLSQYRPCGTCGEPRGFHACRRCDRPTAA